MDRIFELTTEIVKIIYKNVPNKIHVNYDETSAWIYDDNDISLYMLIENDKIYIACNDIIIS